MNSKKSYGEILSTSSMMGGAALVNFFFGILRTKFAALFIGSTGVGLIAGFTAIQTFFTTFAGLGIQTSAVRVIANAISKGDQKELAITVLTIRRICLISGIIGMLAMIAFSPMISKITFKSNEYVLDVAGLSLIVLLSNLSGAQLALLQGMRRIKDIATSNIICALIGSIAATIFYYFMEIRGIVPALIFISMLQYIITSIYSRRVKLVTVNIPWKKTLLDMPSIVKLGLVLMWSSILVNGVNYLTIVLITKYDDIAAVGLFSAAFFLSGMSVNFVLGAMSTDYYPRLATMAHDKTSLNKLVNEQTEIGVLLALPCLFATLALSPWLLQFFYSDEFSNGVRLLQWFVLGCFGRVISWPLGYVMLALNKGRWYLFTETSANLMHIILIIIGLKFYGLEGVAIAFFLLYLIYTLIVFFVCRHLTGFSWSKGCKRDASYMLPSALIMFILSRYLESWQSTLLSFFLTFVISIVCLKKLAHLVGPDHPVTRLINKLPYANMVLKKQKF